MAIKTWLFWILIPLLDIMLQTHGQCSVATITVRKDEEKVIDSTGHCKWYISVTDGKAVIEFTHVNFQNCDAILIQGYEDGDQLLPNSSIVERGSVFTSPYSTLYLQMNPMINSALNTFTAVIRSSTALLPRSVALRAISSSCAEMSWQAPLLTFSSWTSPVYQVRCNTTNAWADVSWSARSHQQCNLSANQPITCGIRVGWTFSTPRFGETIEASSRTHCADQALPALEISPNLPQRQVFKNGRVRWEYNITWQYPVNDCLHPEYPFKIQVNLQAPEPWVWNQYILHVDGDVEVRFRAWAQNYTGALSPPAESNWSTSFLVPQVAPQNFQISSNGTCVMLTWQPPAYPNGPTLGFQYDCGNGWIGVGVGSRGAAMCRFLPNELVTCRLRSFNQVGVSAFSTSQVQLGCLPPMFPAQLNIYFRDEVYHPVANSTHQRRRIIIERDILKQALTDNCNATLSFRLRLSNQSEFTSSGVIDDLDAMTKYIVEIRAVNYQQLETLVSLAYVTGELDPYDGPRLKLIFGTNQVSIMFEPPLTPNGIITHYLYRCSRADLLESLVISEMISADELGRGIIPTLQGFKPGEEIKCKAVAVNNIGNSPITQKSGYTLIPVVFTDRHLMVGTPNGRLVPLTLPKVAVKDLPNFSIITYLMVVRNPSSLPLNGTTIPQRTMCDASTLVLSNGSSSESCYIAAEINSSLVVNDDFVLNVGDGLQYGCYYNQPLAELLSYSFYLWVSIATPAQTRIYQYIESKIITVPPFTCPAPPSVENAILRPHDPPSVNDTVTYTCRYGYAAANRETALGLQCQLTNGIYLEWIGDHLVCKAPESKFPTEAVVGGLSPILIISIIVVIICVIKKRIAKQEIEEAHELPAIYIDPSIQSRHNQSIELIETQIRLPSLEEDECYEDIIYTTNADLYIQGTEANIEHPVYRKMPSKSSEVNFEKNKLEDGKMFKSLPVNNFDLSSHDYADRDGIESTSGENSSISLETPPELPSRMDRKILKASQDDQESHGSVDEDNTVFCKDNKDQKVQVVVHLYVNGQGASSGISLTKDDKFEDKSDEVLSQLLSDKITEGIEQSQSSDGHYSKTPSGISSGHSIEKEKKDSVSYYEVDFEKIKRKPGSQVTEEESDSTNYPGYYYPAAFNKKKDPEVSEIYEEIEN